MEHLHLNERSGVTDEREHHQICVDDSPTDLDQTDSLTGT